MSTLLDLKETLKNTKELYRIRLAAAKSIESILLTRILTRPKIPAIDGPAPLTKHQEYEKIVRATLRQDSNHIRSICMGLQLRSKILTDQIQSLEQQPFT